MPEAAEIAVRDSQTAIETWSGEKLASVLTLAPMIEKAVKAAKAEAKRRLEDDPKAVPGFKVVAGKRTRDIPDAAAFIASTPASLLKGAIAVSIPKVVGNIKTTMGLTGPCAETWLREHAGWMIETGFQAPRVVRDNEDCDD
jgi:hypothetical protein